MTKDRKEELEDFFWTETDAEETKVWRNCP